MLEVGPNGGYLVTGLVIAGITWVVERFFEPLGKFGQLLYGVAALLIILWAVLLLLSVLA